MNKLKLLLKDKGLEIDRIRKKKNRRKFLTKTSLESRAPEKAGISWIETNMPETDFI